MAIVTGIAGLLMAPWQPLLGQHAKVYLASVCAAVCYGGGYVAVYRGMGNVQASHVLLLKPVGALISAVLGVIVLDANVSVNLVVGGLIIVAAGQVTGRSVRLTDRN
jgi:drug/metabolite transporter (DMT)-like permease